MALQLPGTTTTSEGFSTTAAYVNIKAVYYRKEGSKLEITYNKFKDAASRNSGSSPIDRGTSMYSVTTAELEANYLLAFAYAKLKSDIFSGASDV